MIRDMASGDLGMKIIFGALIRRAHAAVLPAVAGLLATLAGCVSPAGVAVESESDAVEPESVQMTTEEQIAALQADVAALEAEVADAQAATDEAQTMAAQAQEEAGTAQAAADAAQSAAAAAQERAASIEAESQAAIAGARASAATAQDKADMMSAEAYRASAVTIAAEHLDPGLLNFDNARVYLAGPESIYISSIGYGDDTFSALLRYRGGTTATVESIFGSAGKLIPDSVDLTRTELTLVSPDTLQVAFVGVGGSGYTGELRYAGDNRLQVAGIRRVTLPPTADELVADAEARADADIAEARADAEAAVAEAEAAVAVAEAAAAAAEAAVADAEARLAAVQAASAADIAEARAAVDAARDRVDVMMAELHRPSAVMIDVDRIDPSLLNLDHATVSVGGPESIYVAGIRYGNDTYSALMRYRGGTTATVDKVFGSAGKLIPDAIDLSHTELSLIAPDVLDVANVGVGGNGYSGQLRYAGGNRFELVGLTPVKLPPTPRELMAQTEARAAARLAAARAATAEAEADTDAARAAVAAAEERLAAVEAQSAAAIAEARADLDSARQEMDMMMAEAYRPSVVMISADRIDPRLLNLDAAEASLAGPESVYISSIRYAGDTYSALLRYRGGTTATVESIFGPTGKLIPDSVDLSQTELTLVEPDVLDVAYVGVGGTGYSGQLRYAGDNRLEVVGIRPVALPPTADELVASARAQAAVDVAEARAAADAEVGEARATADAEVAEANADAAAANADAAARPGPADRRSQRRCRRGQDRRRGSQGRRRRGARRNRGAEAGTGADGRSEDLRRPGHAAVEPGRGDRVDRGARLDLRLRHRLRREGVRRAVAPRKRFHRRGGEAVRYRRRHHAGPRPVRARHLGGRARYAGNLQRRHRRRSLRGVVPGAARRRGRDHAARPGPPCPHSGGADARRTGGRSGGQQSAERIRGRRRAAR